MVHLTVRLSWLASDRVDVDVEIDLGGVVVHARGEGATGLADPPR